MFLRSGKLLLIFLTLLLIPSIVSCHQDITAPPPPTPDPKWESIPLFSNLDIRYITFFDDAMYVSAVAIAGSDHAEGKSVIYRSADGNNWELIKTFSIDAGPMTLHGDTLFVITGDSIYSYNRYTGWRPRYKTPDRLVWPGSVGDIVFIDDNLYAMQTLYTSSLETYRIYPDGSNVEVKGKYGTMSLAGAKFIKLIRNGKEYIYVRPQWNGYTMYKFDGDLYSLADKGLTARELTSSSPTNSMIVHNDTLFASFQYPANVKYLDDNEIWQPYSDTLPLSRSYLLINPHPWTQTTALAFVGERLFVATDIIGIVEWKRNNTWKRYTKGLVLSALGNNELNDLFNPVVFLEYYKGSLYAGYGIPGYAPWGASQGGGHGLYKYKID